MAARAERILDDLRQRRPCAPSLVRGRALVDHRREQRVCEANRPVLALDHLRGERGLELGVVTPTRREHLARWTADGRHEQEGLRVAAAGKSVEACAHKSFQRLGNTERLS